MRFINTIFFIALLSFSTLCFAKTIDLREQPKEDSKVTGKIDTEAGMITIFSPKDSKWIKVADPRNGDVGWIKLKDVSDTGFSVNVFSTGDDKHGYHMIQFGGDKAHTKKQLHEMMENMQKHQMKLQEDIQNMMRDMFDDIEKMPIFKPINTPDEKTGAEKTKQ